MASKRRAPSKRDIAEVSRGRGSARDRREVMRHLGRKKKKRRRKR